MYQEFNKKKAATERYSNMEAETIQKNGARPKSRTSRGNIYNNE